MSEPVKNAEIEDVLSSIRRLVSDGDKARTRDPAPVEAVEDASENVPDTVAEHLSNAPESTPHDVSSDRLVLTPAFMVVESPRDEDRQPEVAAEPEVEPEVEEDPQDADAEQAPQDASFEDHEEEDSLNLTEMVWESVEDAKRESLEAKPADETPSEPVETPDRSSLVATIAELEAAISAGEDEYEPDGSEMMDENIEWPGVSNRGVEHVEDAEVSEVVPVEQDPEAVEEDLETVDDEHFAAFEHRVADDLNVAEDDVETQSETDSIPQDADEYGDDDLDGLLDAGSANFDEEALRAMVAAVVREELTGPLGERITRNVRKLVRREIYRILSSQEFD